MESRFAELHGDHRDAIDGRTEDLDGGILISPALAVALMQGFYNKTLCLSKSASQRVTVYQ